MKWTWVPPGGKQAFFLSLLPIINCLHLCEKKGKTSLTHMQGMSVWMSVTSDFSMSLFLSPSSPPIVYMKLLVSRSGNIESVVEHKDCEPPADSVLTLFLFHWTSMTTPLPPFPSRLLFSFSSWRTVMKLLSEVATVAILTVTESDFPSGWWKLFLEEFSLSFRKLAFECIITPVHTPSASLFSPFDSRFAMDVDYRWQHLRS